MTNFKKFNSVDESAQTNDMSDMVCEDCGCGFAQPEPNCECPHDCSDPEGSNWIHSDETNEALNMQQRLQRGRSARRNKAKMARGRKRAEKRTATPEVVDKRSRKAARKLMYNKLTKGKEISPGQKKEIEARLDKPNMKAVINRLSKKMRPKIKAREKERRASRNSST